MIFNFQLNELRKEVEFVCEIDERIKSKSKDLENQINLINKKTDLQRSVFDEIKFQIYYLETGYDLFMTEIIEKLKKDLMKEMKEVEMENIKEEVKEMEKKGEIMIENIERFVEIRNQVIIEVN